MTELHYKKIDNSGLYIYLSSHTSHLIQLAYNSSAPGYQLEPYYCWVRPGRTWRQFMPGAPASIWAWSVTEQRYYFLLVLVSNLPLVLSYLGQV